MICCLPLHGTCRQQETGGSVAIVSRSKIADISQTVRGIRRKIGCSAVLHDIGAGQHYALRDAIFGIGQYGVDGGVRAPALAMRDCLRTAKYRGDIAGSTRSVLRAQPPNRLWCQENVARLPAYRRLLDRCGSSSSSHREHTGRLGWPTGRILECFQASSSVRRWPNRIPRNPWVAWFFL